MKIPPVSRFVGYYTSSYSEHGCSQGYFDTILLNLCSINHLLYVYYLIRSALPS